MAAKSAPPPQSQPQPLTFPRPIFAALTPHPFLHAHLSASKQKHPLRANGRTAHEFRQLGINTGSLTHCNGSAVVRVGNTAVVCGVRAEILTAEEGTVDEATEGKEEEDEDAQEYKEVEDLRLLVPNVELSTGSTPALLPGNAPSAFAQTLVTRIRNLLLSTRLVSSRQLRILHTPSSSTSTFADATGPNPNADGEEVMQDVEALESDPDTETLVKGYWVLYIDTLFISLDGNAFDAAWLAILSALRDTKLPRAYFDEDAEMILCDDDPSHAHALQLSGLPVPASYAVFEAESQWGESEEDDGEDAAGESKSWVLSDPDAFEESVCRESVTVVVDCSKGGKGKTQIRRIEKSGGGVVDRDVLRSLVKRSTERWKEWAQVLSGAS